MQHAVLKRVNTYATILPTKYKAFIVFLKIIENCILSNSCKPLILNKLKSLKHMNTLIFNP